MTPLEAFEAQSIACGSLGSPFMARLMGLCADRLERGSAVFDRILDWEGDAGPSGHSVPLRLAGALHALKLTGAALVEVYPPNTVSDDALWAAVQKACVTHEAHVLDWLTRPPQTNEVRRSGVILAGLAEIGARYPGQPLRLLELGASGGLNLWADHYALRTPSGVIGAQNSSVVFAPDWDGRSPLLQVPEIVARAGVDLSPLKPELPEDQLKFRAYLWPDQPERLHLTEAALEIARAGSAVIEAGDAAEWLTNAMAKIDGDAVTVVYHTVAWQYFPANTKKKATQAMARASHPVVQLGMEADDESPGAAVTLIHWPEGRRENLGRADFHGRWITWH